jgi:hypothetical protein
VGGRASIWSLTNERNEDAFASLGAAEVICASIAIVTNKSGMNAAGWSTSIDGTFVVVVATGMLNFVIAQASILVTFVECAVDFVITFSLVTLIFFLEALARDSLEVLVRGFLEVLVRGSLEVLVRDFLEALARGFLEVLVRGFLEALVRGSLEVLVRDFLGVSSCSQ